MEVSGRAKAEQVYNEIISASEEIDNEKAEDFIDSVTTKAESIMNWVEENDHATSGQIASLQNMHDGLLRWMR